jgi:OmpA-OmpF porin, OOP family
MKGELMKYYFIIILTSIFYTFSASGQNAVRPDLFNDADKILKEARDKNAPFYAPTNFERGMKYYDAATDLAKRGKSDEDIREKLKDASASFAKSIEFSSKTETTLTNAIAARHDAEKAGAWKYSPKSWDLAEEQFKSAASEIEDNDLENAKDKAGKAESMYRTTELQAIEASYLSPARELLNKANDADVSDNAPLTLENAHKLVAQVEALLKQNRYDTDETKLLAAQAKYEAAHAIYLDQAARKLKQERKTLEQILLIKEFDFKRVASVLEVNAEFDQGFDPVITQLIGAVKERDAKIAQGLDSIRRTNEIVKGRDEEIANLKKQIDLMTQRLGTLSEAEKKLQSEGQELQKKLDAQKQEEEMIKNLGAMFTEEEGTVLRESENLIIRVYGLTFPVGKTKITEAMMPLLEKVQLSVSKFPHARIKLEGHTDSQGSDEVNQKLSELRAAAVAEYLMGKVQSDFPINSEGFGETRPVASNDTPEGRAKNRRIDVVITPELPVAK